MLFDVRLGQIFFYQQDSHACQNQRGNMTHLQTTKGCWQRNVPVKDETSVDFTASKMQKGVCECFMRRSIIPTCTAIQHDKNHCMKTKLFLVTKKQLQATCVSLKNRKNTCVSGENRLQVPFFSHRLDVQRIFA